VTSRYVTTLSEKINFCTASTGQSKAVPLHALEESEGRGGTALALSRSRHQIGVSGQHHAPAALYSPPKGLSVHTVQDNGWTAKQIWTQRLEARARTRTPVVQALFKHYTDLSCTDLYYLRGRRKNGKHFICTGISLIALFYKKHLRSNYLSQR
jgi:hypothetical protein